MVDLMTIGAFARAAGLTPKALRLYADLSLLPPAAVDPESAYRLYAPAQLDRARLIARLRNAGMPLAEIRTVVGLSPVAAAGVIADYGRRSAAGAADRQRRVDLLVTELSPRRSTMTFVSAARTDIGLVRAGNEDAAHADDHLLAVADGMGGPGGAIAAAAAITAVASADISDMSLQEWCGVAEAVAEAVRALGAGQGVDHAAGASGVGIGDAATGYEPGTTLTALLRDGTRLVLLHIGDTRAYLLRDGDLTLLTRDHTWVRNEVEQGRLHPDEVAGHPRRALLTRALGAGSEADIDVSLRTARPGDRYLLCSDGLSTVVDRAAVLAALTAGEDPSSTVDRLVALAHEAGAPDNIACVVADVREG